MVNKTCLECKRKFLSVKSKDRKFCSMDCYHKQAKSHKKGKESPYWKGAKATYGAVHDWIKSIHGNATKCENPKCIYPKKSKNGILEAPKTFDWALKRGRKYSDRKKDSFIQLCRSCHKKYDYKKGEHPRNNKGLYI